MKRRLKCRVKLIDLVDPALTVGMLVIGIILLIVVVLGSRHSLLPPSIVLIASSLIYIALFGKNDSIRIICYEEDEEDMKREVERRPL